MALLPDEEYMALQRALIANPESGRLISGGRGLRKLRWGSPGQGRGKRGGIRTIYFWRKGELLYFLMAYPKSGKDDLTRDEIRALSSIVGKELSK